MQLNHFSLILLVALLFFTGPSSLNAKSLSSTYQEENEFHPSTIDNEKTWGLDAIEAEAAWDLTMGSTSVIVAVIDTGIDANHEELVNTIWTNPLEIPDNGIDDDNNGYIDDINGWNFVDNSTDIMDEFGHGTHVSGTIAAALNDVGIVGVAPNVTIMPLKVFDLSGGEGATNEAIAEAIIYATDQGAYIISMSLGGPAPTFVTFEAIDYAQANDVLMVAASGNEGVGIFQFPSGNPSVIAVGSVDKDLVLSDFSNFGSQQELVAPGELVESSLPGNKYGLSSGTSMATPHVAGVAALLFSLNSSLTTSEVRFILQRTAKDLGEPGWDNLYGSGLVNAKLATKTVLDTEGPSVEFIDAIYTSDNNLNISITARDNVGLFSIGFFYTDLDGKTTLVENQIYSKDDQSMSYFFLYMDNIASDSVVSFYYSDLRGNFGGFALKLSLIVDIANGDITFRLSTDPISSNRQPDISNYGLPLAGVILILIVIWIRRR